MANRDRVVKVPMTAGELRDARRRAKAAGLSLAAYLRRLVSSDAHSADPERAARVAAAAAQLLRQGPRRTDRARLDDDRARDRWGERRDRDDP